MSTSSSPCGTTRSKLVSRASSWSVMPRASRPRRPRATAPAAEPPAACRRTAGGYPSMAEQREDGEDAAVVVLAVGQEKLLEDGLGVALDRTRAEVQLLGDGAIRAALGDQQEDVSFSARQFVEGGAAGGGGGGIWRPRGGPPTP